jgi:UDP-hydrolysing UDP-N-acetyl-D-glucosamine 2-epimerase
MKVKRVCIITGTRAEYGLLYWLLKEIQEDHDLDLQIIVTGAHLSPEFGLTYKTIEQDGFTITSKVEMQLSNDSTVGITKSIGLGVIGFADAFQQINPDIVVVLGDRYEILAACQAALIANIPIAHLHGGETTEGAFDEAIRHSITKMAHLHFVAAEPYRKRVIQLGEAPDRVFNFGAPGLDHIQKSRLYDQDEFEKSINFPLGKTNFLITYHPVTLQNQPTAYAIEQLLLALDNFPQVHIIFTGQNSDPDGKIIEEKILQYIKKNSHRCIFFKSLGQVRYLSAIKNVNVVIGNSSSGLSEVPVFKKPTVNIGDRQKGRIQATSVIDCEENYTSIWNAINLALSEAFKEKLKIANSPYGYGDVSPHIKKVLKEWDSSTGLSKKFYDIDFATNI